MRKQVNSLIVGESENHGNPVQCNIDDCSKSGVFPGVMRTEVVKYRRVAFAVPKFRFLLFVFFLYKKNGFFVIFQNL